MLIVNDDQLRLAGIASLEQRCTYCSQALAAYPLVMSDDTKQTVYHITCALELATDLMVDLFTFFSPPTPYPPLFVLTAPNIVSHMMARDERAQAKGDIYAVSSLLIISTNVTSMLVPTAMGLLIPAVGINWVMALPALCCTFAVLPMQFSNRMQPSGANELP